MDHVCVVLIVIVVNNHFFSFYLIAKTRLFDQVAVLNVFHQVFFSSVGSDLTYSELIISSNPDAGFSNIPG